MLLHGELFIGLEDIDDGVLVRMSQTRTEPNAADVSDKKAIQMASSSQIQHTMISLSLA